MKKMISLFVVLLSLNAFAVEKELSNDATEIASILMNRQVSKCVTEFQAKSPSIFRVAKDESENSEVMRISGMKLSGGDMATGVVELIIETEYVPSGFGFGMVAVYKCRVEDKK
jgi:hypothetical protein